MSTPEYRLKELYRTGQSPLTQLHRPLLAEKEIQVFLKRDDLLHPDIGGNKWRKLKYNLEHAIRNKATGLATFGGAYSNHIAAVSAAAAHLKLPSAGFIRGEEHLPLNPTLQKATGNGMQLIYLSREMYRRKTEPGILQQLTLQLPDGYYILPEGGSNALAVQGCAELIGELELDWDYICAPVGSGGSLAGVIAGANGQGQIIGFPALKGAGSLADEISTLQRAFSGVVHHNFSLQTGYHFGGYAKIKPELTEFMKNFRTQHGIQLDPVYTGKMMFGVFDLIGSGFFPKGSTIVAWHTGGLQGIAGMKQRGIEF